MHHLDERKAHKHPQPIVLQLTSSTGCMLTLIALSPLLTEIHDFDTEITASGYLSTCKPRDSIEGLLICGATTVSKRPNETLVLSLHLKCPLNVSSACVARPPTPARSTTGMLGTTAKRKPALTIRLAASTIRMHHILRIRRGLFVT